MIKGRTATEKAYAKLNLTLDVLGIMPDGYHELVSVMQSVTLCDEVAVSVCNSNDGNRVSVKISGDGFRYAVPSDDRNTAVKAAYVFLDAKGKADCCAEIEIFKRIPVGAGLGGGSADAAAVLRALNTLLETGLSAGELREIGTAVGADVPFCIEGGTMLARGRGEIFSPLPPLPECEIVIVKPVFSVSTAELFRKIDGVRLTARPDTDGLVAALESGDLRGVAHRIFNVFEEAMPPHEREEITELKDKMLDLGALSAAMTGTGSAVFGIFEKGTGAAAQETLARDCESFLCGVI